MISTEDMTDSQAQHYLDGLRAHHPINGAVQDLLSFMIHTQEQDGNISPYNALCLIDAADTAVEALFTECRALAKENSILEQRIHELTYIAAGPRIEGNA